MRRFIIRWENNKFTFEGEIVHCKDCEFYIVEETISRGIIPDIYCRIWQSSVSTDDYCSYGERKEEKQVTGKLNNPDDSLLTKDLEVCKEQKSKLDCISRQQAIEAVVNEWKGGFPQTNFLRTQGFHDWLKRILDNLPPVNKNNAEIATSDGEESTMGQPKIKLYIPLNKYTVDRVNQLLKNECGEYFDEEWLYNELEQIAERIQLSPETLTTSKTETVDTDLISRQAAIEALLDHVNIPTQAQREYAVEIFENIPPVEPKPVCEDAISREWIKNALLKYGFIAPDMTVTELIEDAPPVEPKPVMTKEVREAIMRLTMCAREDCSISKYENMDTILKAFTERPKGEWVRHELWNMPWYTCSECNFHGRNDYKFCPNCGADMRGDKE